MFTWPSRHVLYALFLGTASIGVVGVSCIGTDGDVLRGEVLAHLADEVFLPAHVRFQTDAAALATAVADHCAGAKSEPAAAQAAWKAVRAEWSVTAAFAFGPVITQMQAGPLDFWPVRSDTIEAKILEAPASIDAAWLDGLGTSAKGMPALEYLLFADVLAAGTPRCAYATALADDISRRSEDLASAWALAAEALKTAGEPDSGYASEKVAIDAIVNATIENLYRMVKDKLDRPLGNLTGTAPDPTLLESIHSGTTRDDLENNLQGFAMVYLGADGEPGGEPGLGALVAARDQGLDQRILAQHALARDTLAAIPLPFTTALTDHRSAVQSARDEIDALRRLIKLDVASLLGVTLSLSDNDGD